MPTAGNSAPPSDTKQCKTCDKVADASTTLKQCNGCRSASYCSRDCQKNDWKAHKKECKPCARQKPFHALKDATWLFDRPVKDVYTLLIDSYRLRMEDEYALEQENNNDSLYSGDGTRAAIRGFQKFLTRLEMRHRDLLPTWWTAGSNGECKALAVDSSQWPDLACAIEKEDIVKHYKEPTMPMQLRIFASTVYGKGIMGQSSDAILGAMMAVERQGSVTTNMGLM